MDGNLFGLRCRQRIEHSRGCIDIEMTGAEFEPEVVNLRRQGAFAFPDFHGFNAREGTSARGYAVFVFTDHLTSFCS